MNHTKEVDEDSLRILHLPLLCPQMYFIEGVVVSDTGMPDLKHPALTYALRGVAALEVQIEGPNRDLHSGIYGGAIENPAIALSKLLAKMIDKNGRITVPGFYNDVIKLSAYERRQMARIPFNERNFKKLLGFLLTLRIRFL